MPLDHYENKATAGDIILRPLTVNDTLFALTALTIGWARDALNAK